MSVAKPKSSPPKPVAKKPTAKPRTGTSKPGPSGVRPPARPVAKNQPSENKPTGKSADGQFKASPELNAESGSSQERVSELNGSLLDNYGFDKAGESQSAEPKSSATTGTQDSSRTPTAQTTGREPVENFQYNGQAPGDYRNALNSSDPKAGTKANQKINDEYQGLSEAYRDYLGGDVASFPSMAKNGSYLAGKQIQNLENAQAALTGDPQAMTDAMRGMANKDNIVQGAHLGKGIVERNAGDEKATDVLTNPAGTAGKVTGESAADGLNTMNQMRDSLVAGNTEIHHSAAPAAHAFLEGEADGGKGMEALKKAGYYPGSEKDPHGLYTKAYGMLGQVRDLGLQAAKETDPAKKAQLEKQRDQLMKQSNMNLFSQEQMTLEKPHIYQNKTMKNALTSIGGTMSLDGPNGKYDLLPKGGDWTDYKTRMGYNEVDKPGADTVTLNGKDGKPIHYKPDPNAVGTISHYSNQNTTGQAARSIVDTPVPKLALPVTTSTGAGVDGIGHGLAKGDAGEVAGSAATLPGRITSDLAENGGAALQKNGQSQIANGASTFVRNFQNKPGLSDDVNRAVGIGNIVVGDLKNQVGRGVETAGQVLGVVSEIADQKIHSGVNTGISVAKAANRQAYKARMKLQNKLYSMWPF
jgi:hypothetical protein